MAERIVDACCLINLYASGRFVEIVRAQGGQFFVPERVQAEALSIRKPDAEDATKQVAEPIDLTAALETGVIQQCRVEGRAENEHFVRYATQLDDGEAACLAIAKRRGWTIATDDKKAIRMATTEEVAVITTPELLYRWVETTAPHESRIAQVLRNVERFAHFRLGRTASHYRWWTRLAGR